MKKYLKGVAIGWLLLWGVVMVYAYNTQIFAPVQFVKQLFATPNWEQDSSKATIRLDGPSGTIEAKNIKVNGEDVATKKLVWSVYNNLNSKISSITNYMKKNLWWQKAYLYICVNNKFEITNMYMWPESTKPSDSRKYKCTWNTYKMVGFKQ